MEKLPSTIEDLAAMINMHMASKEDIQAVREDMAEVNGRLDRKALLDPSATLF